MRSSSLAMTLVGLLLALSGAALFLAPTAADSWHEPHPAGALAVGVAGIVLLAAGLFTHGRALARSRSEPLTFLSDDEEAKIVEAIQRFEKRTSGELRVHLEHGAQGELLAHAKKTFESLGLTATRERNAVLFYVAVHDHQFAVLGDTGIHAKVPPGFWDDVVARVRKRFLEQKFGEGLTEGIELAGEALASHFPPRPDDVNELPDTISRGP